MGANLNMDTLLAGLLGDDSSSGADDILAGLIDDSSSGSDLITLAGDDVLAGLLDDSSSGDLIGDLVGDLVGAAARGGRGGNLAQQVGKKVIAQALKARLGGGRRPLPPGARRLQYTPRKYDAARVVPIGFDTVAAVPAFTSATITQRPQEPFRPSRVFIPSDIAGSFLVDDIKVGNRSQLAANGSLPARMFQENATGISLLLDTADPAIDVVLRVTNISGGALRFFAAIVGPAAE